MPPPGLFTTRPVQKREIEVPVLANQPTVLIMVGKGGHRIHLVEWKKGVRVWTSIQKTKQRILDPMFKDHSTESREEVLNN